jgi:hypothetical protein
MAWNYGGNSYGNSSTAMTAWMKGGAKGSDLYGYSADGGGGGGGQAASTVFKEPTAVAPPPAVAPNRFEAGLANSDKRLRSLLDNPDSVQQSAAYKFRVGQGQEALQRSMGARGMLNSGNRLMDLTKYGQDMGSQEYDNQYKRLSDLYGMDSNSYNGNAATNNQAQSVANQGQDIANRFQLGTEANTLDRDKFNYNVKQNKPVGETNSSQWAWQLPGYKPLGAIT